MVMKYMDDFYEMFGPSERKDVEAKTFKESDFLAPCPLCGSEHLRESVNGGVYPQFYVEKHGYDLLCKKWPHVVTNEIMCEECGCSVEGAALAADGYESDNMTEIAIKSSHDRWNRRAYAPEQRLTV